MDRAIGALTIGAGEACTSSCKGVDIRCFADRISITGQRGRSQIIRNNEEHIVFLRRGKRSDYKEKEREDE